jgi:hypothetical protein
MLELSVKSGAFRVQRAHDKKLQKAPIAAFFDDKVST